jgi:hypothetical protein
MIGRVLYAAAFFLCLIYTMDSSDACALKGHSSYKLLTTVVVLREQVRQRSAATTPEK